MAKAAKVKIASVSITIDCGSWRVTDALRELLDADHVFMIDHRYSTGDLLTATTADIPRAVELLQMLQDSATETARASFTEAVKEALAADEAAEAAEATKLPDAE